LRKWRLEYEQHGSQGWAKPTERSSSPEAKIAELERVIGQLTVEYRVLDNLDTCPLTIEARHDLVDALKGTVSVRQLCVLLGVSRNWYYAAAEPTPTAEDTTLRDRIEAIVLEFPGDGYRRVTATLHREQEVVNHKRVLRIMREESLLCQLHRRCVTMTDSRHALGSYPNRIKELVVDRLNQAWQAEEVYLKEYTDFADAEWQVGHFIDAVHNA
jgi:hypothetical protein